MKQINIPGRNLLTIENVVFDYNGTLAVDGGMLPGVAEKLTALADSGFRVYILTADTFGCAAAQCEGLPVTLRIFGDANIAADKKDFVNGLDPAVTAAIGNGQNDEAMFAASTLAIAVLGQEGTCVKSLLAADIVVTSPLDAMDLLLRPKRLVATLRT
jgi:soluble P-type ATPase